MAESLVDQVPEPEEGAENNQRPDWLPEKYWDDENSEAKVRDVVTALTDTQTALRNRKDEMREEIIKELAEGTPETPEGYKIDLEGIEAPDLDADAIMADPEVELARQWAHDNKVPQEAFSKLVREMIQVRAQAMPKVEDELKKLGEHAVPRVQRLDALAKKSLSDEEMNWFRGYLSTADAVVVLEKLLNEKRLAGPGSFEGTGGAESLRARLAKLQSKPGYWHGSRDYDPGIAEEAQKIIQQLENAR